MPKILRRLRHLLLCLLCGLVTTGCNDSVLTLTINPDGSGRYELDINADYGMFARMIQGGRGVALEKSYMEAQGLSMMASVVAGMTGIEAWTEATHTVDRLQNGKIRLVGYFKDISEVKFTNGGSMFSAVLPTTRHKLIRNPEGSYVIEVGIAPRSATEKELAALSPAAPKFSTEELKQRTLEMEGDAAILATMKLKPFGMKNRLRVRIAVPEVLTTTVFKKEKPGTAVLEYTWLAMAENFATAVKDSKKNLERVRKYGGLGDAINLELMGSAENLRKMEIAMLKGEQIPSVTAATGDPLFDYAAEKEKANAAASEETKKHLAQIMAAAVGSEQPQKK